MTVLFRPNQVMFDNVDSTNVVTNTNDEEVTIPPGYYTIGEIIAIFNIMIDTSFSISTRLRVMGVSESSSHTPSTSPMLQIFEKSSVWKDERSFYSLRSMDRTWLISLEIAKWSTCTRRSCDPPIWRLPTRTTISLPRWSWTIPKLATSAPWRTSAFQW